MPAKAEMQQQIEELKKSERQYRTLIENHPYGIHENDTEGIITFANPAYHQVFEYPEGESAIGRPIWTTLTTEEERQELREYLAYLVHQQPPAEAYEAKSWTVNGKPLDIRVDWDYKRDEEGQVVGFVSVTTDITEQKQAQEELQESQELAESAINSLPGIFYLFDSDGNFMNWNKNFEAVSGYSGSEIATMHPLDFFSEGEKPKVAATVQEIFQQGQGAVEAMLLAKDGKQTPYSFVGSRTIVGGTPSLIGMGINITERKRAEMEREQLQKEVIEAQQRAIKELSTPVIPLMETSQGGILVMPLVGSIDSMRAKDLMRTLLAGISQHRAKVVILDVTGVPLVDSGVANHLNKTIMAARLKGARTIVTGITDAVAETIVDLGIDWGGIETLSDLQTGLVAALGSLGIKLAQSR
jgi:rsbT co-antagonist protein RsbR